MVKERPLYICRRTVGPMTIDGRLDEPSWAAAEPMTLTDTVTGEPPKQSTEVRAMWDDECLYVGFHAVDTDAWATMTKREDMLADEEVVEIFVDADCDGIGYAEYEINPLGTLMDIFVLNRDGDIRIMYDTEPEAIRHAVIVDGDATRRGTNDRSWTVEWAIPFSEFPTAPNIPPQNGDSWRINFYRIDRPDAESFEYTAWSPTGIPRFHVPGRFGAIVFSTEPVVGG
jgi:hypothetical protein